MASSETLLAASSALNSLLARRQKQKQKTQAAGNVIKCIPRTSPPKNRNKKLKTSTTKILSEEDEARRLKEAKEKKVEANVKILRELGRTGRKEKVVMGEVCRSPSDSLPFEGGCNLVRDPG